MSATRKPFENYTPAADGNLTMNDAIEEIRRELRVRRRVYDRWLAAGDLTWQEGDGRMRAMMTALRILNELPSDHPVPGPDAEFRDTPQVSPAPY